MRKPQRSIRLAGESEKNLGRKVVRLTLNPVLLFISRDYVDWSGREKRGGKLRPSDLVLKARERFPELPLSWAVEGYIVLLATRDYNIMKPWSIKPYSVLPKHVRRFSVLSPVEKIRIGERWKREIEILRGSK